MKSNSLLILNLLNLIKITINFYSSKFTLIILIHWLLFSLLLFSIILFKLLFDLFIIQIHLRIRHMVSWFDNLLDHNKDFIKKFIKICSTYFNRNVVSFFGENQKMRNDTWGYFRMIVFEDINIAENDYITSWHVLGKFIISFKHFIAYFALLFGSVLI